jgi:hypothetical protein
MPKLSIVDPEAIAIVDKLKPRVGEKTRAKGAVALILIARTALAMAEADPSPTIRQLLNQLGIPR